MIILETKRLILRTWTYRDAETVFEICKNAEVMEHIGDGKPYESIEKAKKFLNWVVPYQQKNGFCRWAVVEKSSEKIIGSCGFMRLETGEIELGYLFTKDIWGNGYATEAAKGCIKYGFEKIGFEKMIALTDIDHTATHRVLEKSGFTRRGIENINGDDDLVFEITNPNGKN